jgi:hypothetical protein
MENTMTSPDLAVEDVIGALDSFYGHNRPLPGHGERGAAAPTTLAAAAAGGQRLVVVEGSVMGGWSRVPPLLR